MLPWADLYSGMPELVDNSDDDEMPPPANNDEMPPAANSDQQGDLPPFEWNHQPERGVSHEPTEDRILTRLMGRRWRRGEKAQDFAASKRR